MAAISKSIYEQVIIESADGSKTIDLKLGIASIDYYEDIFSPTITAKIVVGNTGDTIKDSSGKLTSVYTGLPIRGKERILLKIAGNSAKNPGLDFSKKNNLYVSSVSNVIRETQRESFVLHLVSKEALINETTRVPKKFPTSSRIDVSVRKIIKDYLKSDRIKKIDETSNPYGFSGNLRKPFTILVWLASKSVPNKSKNSSSGFVFYQTQDGFYFRSIDQMITESPKAKYVYTDVNKSCIERNNDFTILKYNINTNQNLLEKLRLGTYSSSCITFNPNTFEITFPDKSLFKSTENISGTKNLGQTAKVPDLTGISNQPVGMGDRIFTSILDIGTLEKEVSTEKNAEPSKYQSQSVMRYNVLFTQTVYMTVPSNTNLRAGDIIECEFPKISGEKGAGFDVDQSGLYMIKELCHHFDTDASYTSMMLIRDTFGKHGKNNKK